MTDATITARDYLARDYVALHGQRKLSAIVGIVLIVVVFGYMTWLYAAVRNITKPDNLASAMTGFVEASLPDWKRSAKGVITSEAPRIARYVGDTVVRELPAVLRAAIEGMVIEYTKDIADSAAHHLEAAYVEVITGARDELKRAVVSGVEQDQALILSHALDHQLERAAKGTSNNPFEESVLVKLEKSQKALTNLNDRLEKMLAPGHEPTTRRGKLERRFILTFWKFMQQENSDLRVDDAKAGKGKPAR